MSRKAKLKEKRASYEGGYAMGRFVKDKQDDIEIEALKAENAKLRKVLAWYGDGGKYDFQNTYSMTSEINKDRGQRAREALSND